MTSACLSTSPRRSLSAFVTGERFRLMLEQLEAERAGDDDMASFCEGQIEAVDKRLREIEEAANG